MQFALAFLEGLVFCFEAGDFFFVELLLILLALFEVSILEVDFFKFDHPLVVTAGKLFFLLAAARFDFALRCLCSSLELFLNFFAQDILCILDNSFLIL